MVALIGAFATWLIVAKVSDLELQRRHDAFSAAAQDRLLVLQREVAHSLGVVQDIGSFFDASRHVTRRQFREFVGPALKRNPSIQRLVWIPRVEAGDRSAFIAEARREFAPFDILEPAPGGTARSAAKRTVHYPVLYVQPYQDNRDVLGVDLAANPDDLAALEEAALAASLRVSMLQSDGEGPTEVGFTVYLPVYERAEESGSPADPPQVAVGSASGRLRGYASGLFRVEQLVEDALANLRPGGVDLRFFASGSVPPGQPFYVHSSRARLARGVAATHPREPIAYHGEIRVGNLTWNVVCHPVPGHYEPDVWSSRLILGGGIAFTLLACVYLFTMIGRAREVRRLVAQRTLELSRSNEALNTEINERRRAEQALQLLNTTLELRVARRAAEAERRARDLEQFAYVASHDLKAPLRGIANLAGWLKEDLQDRLTPETAEQLDLLRDRVARMHSLIEGLLAYSRIGRTAGSITDVDSAQLVADTIDSIAPSSRFKIKVRPDMPRLRTDRLHLGQVFANLIGNAIKHHDRKKGVIRVSGRDLGDRCAFEVEDDGPGIPPEYKEKVFMMFQTLKIKDFDGNTGIGLALVKKIVEEHGGTIKLESGPGRGSRFTFSWAKEEPDAETRVTESPAERLGGNNG
jgi:signal transduction histidine kinase